MLLECDVSNNGHIDRLTTLPAGMTFTCPLRSTYAGNLQWIFIVSNHTLGSRSTSAGQRDAGLS